MKWFEQHEYRDEQSLSPEQMCYLRRPSMNAFMPINAWACQQWDILIAFPCLIACLFLIVSMDAGIREWLLISNISVTGDMIFFSIKHGRRLAWNRNEWKSFEEFQQSETKWLPWGVVGYIAGLVLFYYGLQHPFISERLWMSNAIIPILLIYSSAPFLSAKFGRTVPLKAAYMPLPPGVNEERQ